MFLAGILPGLLLAASFAVVIFVIGLATGFPKGDWFTRSEALSALLYCLPAALIPIAIIGGILLGIATPTESAAIASLIAFLIGWLVYGELKPHVLFEMFKRTAINASMIIFMIAAANVFGWVIIYEALPQKLAALITSITSDPFLFLLIVNLILLFVGMLIDGIAAVILISPILLPIAMNDYNISPYQFGVVMCLNLVLGLLTPPVGVGLYIASSVSNVSPWRILKSLWPFLLAVAAILVLLSRFPWLSTALI
jgi:tripartite ATP-independent transporter DctM subunit